MSESIQLSYVQDSPFSHFSSGDYDGDYDFFKPSVFTGFPAYKKGSSPFLRIELIKNHWKLFCFQWFFLSAKLKVFRFS